MTDDNKEIPMPKAEETPEEPVSLNLNDIHYCRKIIEIAVEKGTGIFKPEELEVVGATYNKITKWLMQNQPKADDNTESTDQKEKKND